MLTKNEIDELERFKKRRKAFGGELAIMNVHCVPKMFPHIYVGLYGNKVATDLFCSNGAPCYSDYNKDRAKEFEDYLTNSKKKVK